MKKYNVINTLLIAGFVFLGRVSLATTTAQTLSAAPENVVQPSQSGFYAGLEYANLTDVRMDWTIGYSNEYGNFSKKETQKGGTSLGVLGLSIGYQIKNPNENPIRISSDLRVMESINISETGGSKITFIVPELNLGYLWTDKFETYGGVSLPFMRGENGVDNYETRGGLNLGLAAHVTQKMTLKAAYNAYAFHYDLKDSNANLTGKLDFIVSGLALSAQMNF
jgi:hypothetical protein